MIIRCDKFFIEELQAAGYDLDGKKIREIYKRSREKNFGEIQKKKARYRKEEAAIFATAAELDNILKD